MDPTATDLRTPEYLRALLEQSPDGLMVHDRDGRFVDVSDRTCEFLGYTREQLLEMRVRDVEKRHHLFLNDIHERLAQGESLCVRGTHQRADGSHVEVDVRLKNLGDESGLVCCWIRPVVSTHEAYEAAASSQELERTVYRKVFDSARDAIAVIDHEGRYLIQNPAHQKLLGFNDEELVDKTPAIHLGPQAFQEIATRLAESGTYVGEHVSRSKSGGDVRIELSAFAVTYTDGRPPLFVGIKRNIDERDREYRQEVDRRTRELEESLRHAQKMELIGQLAAGVAHDFNNMLTPILGYADLELATAGSRALGPTTQESLHQIREAAQRGKELTQQLLAFGRKQVLSKSALDLREFVPVVERMLRRLITEDVAIEVHVAPDVDPVLADATAIEQILMNLVTNAHDAMPNGGTIKINVHPLKVPANDPLARVLGEEGGFVELVVSDDGQGMDDETLARVFDPFFTLKQRGTGLGLSIVHSLVGQHDGYLHAESVLGSGSKFRIILPRCEESVEAASVEPTAVATQSGGTILVAEDEPQVRKLVQRMLEAQGYHVLVAADGLDALAVAADYSGDIDLLLTDVVMPGLGGRELYEKLRAERPGVSVLFMSGYAGDALDVEPSEVLTKPFSAAALAEQVTRVLA